MLKPQIILIVCYNTLHKIMSKIFSLCITACFAKQKVTKKNVFWINMVPLLLRVLKALFSTLSKMLVAVRLYSKQHDSCTCTEFRLQCLVQFRGAEATPESQMCWP